MAAITGLIRVMERAARKAGTRLRRDFGEIEHLQVSRKGPSDFVSKADQIAERTLYDELGAARPGWGQMRALRGQRLCVFTPEESDVLIRPGPRMAEAARLMAACLERHAGGAAAKPTRVGAQ